MAYNQAPSRSPLIDNSLKEALQRREQKYWGSYLSRLVLAYSCCYGLTLPTTEVSGLLAMNLLKIY